jgi:hypothetical protein
MPTMSDLREAVSQVIDANVYMVLSTADESGQPWVSPVFFATADQVDFYWISAPDTIHSRNLVARPGLSIVIFNSQVPPGQGQARAVYLSGEAGLVPAPEIARGLEIYPGLASRGGRIIAPEEVTAPGPYRLYRARVSARWVLCPRPNGQACAEHGKAYDHRTEVPF